MKLQVINPDYRRKIMWDSFILLITIAITIIVPLITVYRIPMTGWLFLFDFFITMVFILDIYLESHTGIYEQREYRDNLETIRNEYKRTAMPIDILAALPLYMILTLFNSPLILEIAIYANLFRLVKLFRVRRTISRIRNSKKMNPSFIRMALLIFWILIAAHLISCGWIYITGGLGDAARLNRYIVAFYWTVTTLTTIGYGDITPDQTNNAQIMFIVVIELIGAGMYGFIIGNISNIIANIDIAKSQYQEKMEKVSTFMKYKHIPVDLKDKINDYYDYLWKSRRGYDESSILMDLPKPLQTSVSLFLNREIIQKVPLFEGTSEEFIKDIILNLKPIVFTPDDYVFIKGEIGYEMYFISRGSIDVVSEDEQIVYATLGAGSFFGEIALLFSAPRNATIKAREYCDCYSLKKDTFDEILGRFPEFAKRISKEAGIRRAETEKKQQDN
ncbi:MAG: hypothetical protein B6241_00130 [Spirochaetaceae bacterium 4572_59]|nr:MAG: hypothetical protein B6241_00130 [Spirochaetaceae bacterium 4572_59]